MLENSQLLRLISNDGIPFNLNFITSNLFKFVLAQAPKVLKIEPCRGANKLLFYSFCL